MMEDLLKYFETTPIEVIAERWDKNKKYDHIKGPSIGEVISRTREYFFLESKPSIKPTMATGSLKFNNPNSSSSVFFCNQRGNSK